MPKCRKQRVACGRSSAWHWTHRAVAPGASKNSARGNARGRLQPALPGYAPISCKASDGARQLPFFPQLWVSLKQTSELASSWCRSYNPAAHQKIFLKETWGLSFPHSDLSSPGPILTRDRSLRLIGSSLKQVVKDCSASLLFCFFPLTKLPSMLLALLAFKNNFTGISWPFSTPHTPSGLYREHFFWR